VGDEAKQPKKRHRVHNGLSGTRLDRGAVLLEVWTPPNADGGGQKPFYSQMLTSVEWVDLIAGVIVGDHDVSATELNSLRSDIARMHERWRASVEQRAAVEAEERQEPDDDG
jgi:hypothetical protein